MYSAINAVQIEEIERDTNMKMEQIPFAVASSSGRSMKNNASELVNLYVHLDSPGGKSKSLLLSTPGAEVITVFDYDILGFYKFKGVLYAVTEKYLYTVTKDTETGLFNKTIVGPVSLEGEVSFSDNGIEMVFVAEGGYAYDPDTDTLKDMSTETGWYPSNTVTYMDGYFIFSRTNTGQFFISKLYSSELDPIDWATGEAAPDDTVAVKVVNRQLWVIGEKSCEVWYDSGDPLFPFTRIPGAVIDIGAVSYKTVAKALDTLFFVGYDLKVYISTGYTLQAVSTQAIEFQMANTDLSKIDAFTFFERGRWFYALTIDDNKTYVYDTQTTLWHTRESDNVGRWAMSGIYNAFEEGLIYGYAGKEIFLVSEDLYTENGKNILREIISLPISHDVNRIRIHGIEMDMEVGAVVPAELFLQISNDGGKSWSTKNKATTGQAGQAYARVRWLRLGQHRNLAIRVSTSSPTPITILSLSVRAK